MEKCKCISCKENIPEEDFEDVPDRQMCSKCWIRYRYGYYEDSFYDDIAKIDDEYNYIGLYPHYEREIN